MSLRRTQQLPWAKQKEGFSSSSCENDLGNAGSSCISIHPFWVYTKKNNNKVTVILVCIKRKAEMTVSFSTPETWPSILDITSYKEKRQSQNTQGNQEHERPRHISHKKQLHKQFWVCLALESDVSDWLTLLWYFAEDGLDLALIASDCRIQEWTLCKFRLNFQDTILLMFPNTEWGASEKSEFQS